VNQPQSISEVRVRYSETDQMGVVYHTHYLVWCEVGRTDLIRQLGMPYAELERQGLRLAVAEVHVRYHAAARYDDLVRIRTRVERVQSRAITFGYELTRLGPAGPERLATAETKLVALGATGAPRTLPDRLLERFREVAAAPA
jgi:acyl-CoA thioester hydrolase